MKSINYSAHMGPRTIVDTLRYGWGSVILWSDGKVSLDGRATKHLIRNSRQIDSTWSMYSRVGRWTMDRPGRVVV